VDLTIYRGEAHNWPFWYWQIDYPAGYCGIAARCWGGLCARAAKGFKVLTRLHWHWFSAGSFIRLVNSRGKWFSLYQRSNLPRSRIQELVNHKLEMVGLAEVGEATQPSCRVECVRPV